MRPAAVATSPGHDQATSHLHDRDRESGGLRWIYRQIEVCGVAPERAGRTGFFGVQQAAEYGQRLAVAEPPFLFRSADMARPSPPARALPRGVLDNGDMET